MIDDDSSDCYEEDDDDTRYEWIVIQYDRQPAIQKCLRCGETDEMPFGKELDYAVLLMEAFIKYHSRCKERRVGHVD